jgi:hypothetical protein
MPSDREPKSAPATAASAMYPHLPSGAKPAKPPSEYEKWLALTARKGAKS